jgi:hypothetical protein
MKPGSPFQFGSLSSVVVSFVLVCAFVFWYFTDPDKRNVHLVMIFFSLSTTIGAYRRYRKLTSQNGADFIGDL